MPPDLYDKLYIPIAKKMIDAWVERGFNVWCHWDNDLTADLASIKTLADGLPKGRLLIDFEKTDMKQAKEILGGTIRDLRQRAVDADRVRHAGRGRRLLQASSSRTARPAAASSSASSARRRGTPSARTSSR